MHLTFLITKIYALYLIIHYEVDGIMVYIFIMRETCNVRCICS